MQSSLMDLITIDRRSTLHFDIQIKESIKALVLDQTFYYHTILPTPDELAKHMSIPKKTVISAYDQLVIERYVKKHDENTYEISYFELTNYFFDRNTTVYDAIISLGLKPSIQCLEKKVVKLSQSDIDNMGFDNEKGNRYLYINRLYLGDHQPIMILENYLPLSIFPDIYETLQGDEPLDAFLDQHYHLKAIVSKRITKAVNLTNKLAKILNERKNAASFQSTNRNFDKYGRMIDFGRSHTICSYYFQVLIERKEMNQYFPEEFSI